MKLKQYLILGIGMIVGLGISIAGISYASKDKSNQVNLITSEKAKSVMLNKVPGANILEFSYDGDEITPKYDGTLIKDDYEYEIDVNAKTGEVIKFEKGKIAISNSGGNSNGMNNVSTSNQQSTVKSESVQSSQNSQQSTVKSEPAQSSQNSQQSTTKQDSTQNNMNNNTSSNNNSYIGEAKAKSIMLNKVPGATIKQFYLDNDETPEYEAELIKGDIEYDISIDARTGAIKEFSQERIEKYDD